MEKSEIVAEYNFIIQIMRPAVKRNIGFFLISIPLFFVSMDIISMLLIGEITGLFMMQYFSGLFHNKLIESFNSL